MHQGPTKVGRQDYAPAPCLLSLTISGHTYPLAINALSPLPIGRYPAPGPEGKPQGLELLTSQPAGDIYSPMSSLLWPSAHINRQMGRRPGSGKTAMFTSDIGRHDVPCFGLRAYLVLED